MTTAAFGGQPCNKAMVHRLLSTVSGLTWQPAIKGTTDAAHALQLHPVPQVTRLPGAKELARVPAWLLRVIPIRGV
jgi:hypothetical protein